MSHENKAAVFKKYITWLKDYMVSKLSNIKNSDQVWNANLLRQTKY